MIVSTRILRKLALAALATTTFLAGAVHAAYPDRPIKLVVPFTPGGVTDVIGRSIAQRLSVALGQPVVVENKPGASGIIATDLVAKSAPDGYTLLLAAIGQGAVNNHLYRKLPYDPKADLAPVMLVAEGHNVLVVNGAGSPYKSVADLVAAGKQAPGQLTYGSFGNGSSSHLSAATFAASTHTEFTHIPYKGSAPAMADLLAGHTAFMFDSLNTALPQIRAGKLRALAVTGPKRSPLLPDVPTMAEAGVPGYNITAWFGIHVQGKTPAAIVQRLNKELVAIAHAPDLRQRFAEQGVDLVSGSPADYAAFLDAENRKWAAIVKQANVTLD
ncbi:hypothetical protein BKK81_29505 [Cupriavidus sp. USMAHM13]|nr:hypothetical protein BKK81_29505 [Cupriavidus sp. USMAHM13]